MFARGNRMAAENKQMVRSGRYICIDVHGSAESQALVSRSNHQTVQILDRECTSRA